MKTSRRTFIRTFGAASAAAAGGFPFFASAMPSQRKEKLGIALIGLGSYAMHQLAPGLQQTDYCNLAGIIAGPMDDAKIWTEKFNVPQKNVYFYDNFDEIAGNKDIDVVYVVLPNNMHKEYTIRAANAGKHVICEKPMAMNAAECREMIEACRKAGVFLSIGYRLRYEPYTLQIERFAREQTYGKIRFVNAAAGFRMGRPVDSWRVKAKYGGGALMDMGPYPIQAARYATGLEPVAVTAQQFNPDPEYISEVDETTTFQLEFPGGIFAQCMTTFAGNVNFLKVSAEKGQYGLEPFSSYGGLHGFLPGGETFDFPPVHQQARQMDAMCRAIMEGRPSKTPGEEGLRDMIIIDAIRESAGKGGKRMQLRLPAKG